MRVVVQLGLAQLLAWASSFYLPAMLAVPMARDTGTATTTVYAAFSAALIISAAVGPAAGRAIDRWGGRPVLVATNVIFALGLTGLAMSVGARTLVLAWLAMGVGMGAGLYEAAFATIVRLHGTRSRGAITGVTLIAGFASTVGWPLSSFIDAQQGWRAACLAWAALHLVVALPLNLSLPRAAPLLAAKPATPVAALPELPPDALPLPRQRRMAVALSFVFATTLFVSTAMAAHLPRVLQLSGASVGAAVTAGALVGPAQVGARLLEYGFLRRLHPLLSARLATVLHPLGAASLALAGAPAALVFGVLHGAGNGILTIAKGTLPLALFGPAGYGMRQGLLMIPARIVQAFAPLAFDLCLDRWGAAALWVSAALSLSALAVLAALPRADAFGARPESPNPSSSSSRS
jgi:MFS family permease